MTSLHPSQTTVYSNYTEDKFVWEGGSFPYKEPGHQEGHEFYEKAIVIAPVVGAFFLMMLVAAGVYVLRHFDSDSSEEESKYDGTRKSPNPCVWFVRSISGRGLLLRARGQRIRDNIRDIFRFGEFRNKISSFLKRLVGTRHSGVFLMLDGRQRVLVEIPRDKDLPEVLV